MDARERDRIEQLEELPDFGHSDAMDGTCVACGCRVGDHFVKLAKGSIGMAGCAVALARKLEQAS